MIVVPVLRSPKGLSTIMDRPKRMYIQQLQTWWLKPLGLWTASSLTVMLILFIDSMFENSDSSMTSLLSGRGFINCGHDHEDRWKRNFAHESMPLSIQLSKESVLSCSQLTIGNLPSFVSEPFLVATNGQGRMLRAHIHCHGIMCQHAAVAPSMSSHATWQPNLQSNTCT